MNKFHSYENDELDFSDCSNHIVWSWPSSAWESIEDLCNEHGYPVPSERSNEISIAWNWNTLSQKYPKVFNNNAQLFWTKREANYVDAVSRSIWKSPEGFKLKKIVSGDWFTWR